MLTATSARSGDAPVSTHIVITDGSHQSFVLTAEHAASAGAAKTSDPYVILDPDVFHPDSDADGDSPVRTFPGTRMSDGETVTLVADGPVITADGAPVDEVLAIGAAPVIDGSAAHRAPPPCDIESEEDCDTGGGGGGGSGGGGANSGPADLYGQYPFVGLRTLRVDEALDRGYNPWNNDMEVALTEAPGDNYASPFGQLNTRRFDGAFWTNIDEWFNDGLFPPSEYGVYSTVNELASVISPLAGGEYTGQALWFKATDVNHAGVDYHFQPRSYILCSYNLPFFGDQGCDGSQEVYDFPLAFLGGGAKRSVMHEDDRDVGRFSRRSGQDFAGPIRTYNFNTGGQGDVTTRIDAANHAITTDDRPFRRSGLRGMSQARVQQRAGTAAGLNLDVGGLQWKLSYGVMNVTP